MGLTDTLRRLLGGKPVSIGELNRRATGSPSSAPRATQPTASTSGVEITPEYERVKSLVDGGQPIVFVSGSAGTGKSTLVRYLRDACAKNVVVVAPTGVAALHVEGVTIHSFFRLPHRVVTNDDVEPVSDRMLYGKLDLLLVDEVSMVRADLVDAMDRFLRLNGRDRSKPFGGTQVVFVGDLFQLPPVVNRHEEQVLNRRYKSPYFFSAIALQEGSLVAVELLRIFRQRDPEFMGMLNSLRVAENVVQVVTQINAACAKSRSESVITLTCTNATADRLNDAELAKLPGRAQLFTGESRGKFRPDQQKLPAPMNLRLKPGAQVMFTKNDEERRWVNGTMARVTDLKPDSITVELMTDEPGRFHDVPRVTWESYRYEYDPMLDRIIPRAVGSYTQYPLMLAWAVTIHKGQGKTLERVHVDLGNGAFASGQVYVALSRCRSLKDISLERPIRPSDVKCDARIRCFYGALEGLQREDAVET